MLRWRRGRASVSDLMELRVGRCTSSVPGSAWGSEKPLEGYRGAEGWGHGLSDRWMMSGR